MSFSQLRICSDILNGLKEMQIESPSPLQRKIIHAIRSGNDLIVQAPASEEPETGWLVPVLDQIAREERRVGTRAILLTGDADRTADLDKLVRGIGAHAGIETVRIDERADESRVGKALSAGPSILVATPEHLASVMEENRIVFREVRFLIFDRVEQIAETEVLEVIRKRIIGTFQQIAAVGKPDGKVTALLESILREPQTIQAEKKEKEKEKEKPEADGVKLSKKLTQYFIKVPPRRKISTLLSQIGEGTPAPVLIFTASRRTADRLYRILRKNDLRAVSLHGGLDKETFSDRLNRFTSGNVQHLIAGELSISDLPVDTVAHVINYDVPEEVDEYKLRAALLHEKRETRIVSLVSKQDRGDIREIIEQLGHAPEELPLPEELEVTPEKRSKNGKKKDAGKPVKKSPPKGRGKPPRSSRSGKDERSEKDDKKKRPGYQAFEPPRTGAPEGLPRPSYDKLSGGRSGKKQKEAKGIVGFFRKLFS